MSEAMRMWVEIIFNIGYLIAVWTLVALMVRHRANVAPENRAVAKRGMWAFALLALGDTGHVGFRVLAYALGGLETQPIVLGSPISLVGIGALATAITVTFFYILVVDVWRLRYNKPLGIAGWFLLAIGIFRLIIMLFPQNEWSSVVPPQPWGLIRNLPLMIMGLGVMVLILRDAYRINDRSFKWIGWCILASYAFYTPVILWVQEAPMLGMLMIPKTLAYIAIAVIAYRALYAQPEEVVTSTVATASSGF
jgi:hypothetical protein